MLRNLAVYHTKDANSLFMVRIAQGLLHMGKGTHTLSPQYSDRFLISRASLAGLMIVLTACLDVKSSTLQNKSSFFLILIECFYLWELLVTLERFADVFALMRCRCVSFSVILGKHHYLLYYLVPAIQSRMLVCFDEELKPITTSVRVGTVIVVIHHIISPLILFRVFIFFPWIFRRLTPWAKPVDPRQSPVSRLTLRRYFWAMANARNSPRTTVSSFSCFGFYFFQFSFTVLKIIQKILEKSR